MLKSPRLRYNSSGEFSEDAEHARCIAKTLEDLGMKMPVEFDFNGVTITIDPYSDARELERDYQEALRADAPKEIGPRTLAEQGLDRRLLPLWEKKPRG